jgi:hypothetical protein
MAIGEYDVDTGTSIGTTEYSLLNDSTTVAAATDDGIFQPVLELNNLAADDAYDLAVYEKVVSGGTQRKHLITRFEGVQADPVYIGPAFVLMHGWDFTLQRDSASGADRSIAWSIRQAPGAAPTETALSAQTLSTTEHSFATDTSYDTGDAQTTDALVQLWWENTAAWSEGDVFELRRYEKAYAAATQRQTPLVRPQHLKAAGYLVVTPLETLLHGWDYTGIKIAGTDRDCNASLRKVA